MQKTFLEKGLTKRELLRKDAIAILHKLFDKINQTKYVKSPLYESNKSSIYISLMPKDWAFSRAGSTSSP